MKMKEYYSSNEIITIIEKMMKREKENCKRFYEINVNADNERKNNAAIYCSTLTEFLYRLEN